MGLFYWFTFSPLRFIVICCCGVVGCLVLPDSSFVRFGRLSSVPLFWSGEISFVCSDCLLAMACPWPFLAQLETTAPTLEKPSKTFAKVAVEEDSSPIQPPPRVVMETLFELRSLLKVTPLV